MLVSVIYQHDSAKVYTRPPSFPARWSQGPSLSPLGHAANSDRLSILHVVMYVSTLCSPFVCCSPSPSVHKPVLSASPLPPCRWVHQYHLSRFRMHVLIHDINLSLSDILHCVTGSTFIHFIRTDSSAFLSMAEYHSIIYMY